MSVRAAVVMEAAAAHRNVAKLVLYQQTAEYFLQHKSLCELQKSD